MNDLISRQAAIDVLERKKDKNAKGDIGGFYNKIIQNDIDAIAQLPSTERNGRWEWDGEYFCSICGYREPHRKPLFCGGCGAKMEEVTK